MAEVHNSDFIPLVMAGGSGTRFWPMSQPQMPKQYLTLFGNRSLIQSTVDRLIKKSPAKNIYICSGESQKKILQAQLPQITGLILEPTGRNTAPCLMLSVATLLNQGIAPSSVMGVFPSDHIVGDEPAFLKALQNAIDEARSSKCLITFGIKPTHPHTGYGYIEAGQKAGENSFSVKQFVEKPSSTKAQLYISQGNFFWNAGIFVWRLDTIAEAFSSFLPAEWKKIQLAVKNNSLSEIYNQLTSQPIDVAVLEKASNVRVIPVDMNWSDIGSWNALLEYHQAFSGKDNVVISRTPDKSEFIDSHNCLIASDTPKKIALIGVKDLIVVETENGLLITHRTQDQKVKELHKD